MKRHVFLGLLYALALVMMGTLISACGGKKEEAKAPAPKKVDDDALALLPSGPIAVGTVDGRAFLGSPTFGGELAKLVEKYVPLGQDAGFSLTKDVDRVTFASYSYQGVDVAAIVIGRFDQAKIKQAVQSGSFTKSGAPVVTSSYAGHDVYVVSNAGFTLLSERMAIAGTEQGIRRVLDRIKDDRVKRDLAPWMIQTIETPGAAAAVAADFGTQPIPAALTQQIPMPFVQNLKAARLVASFKEPGVQLAGSLTYPDDAAAAAAQPSVKKALDLSRWLTVIGVTIQNPQVALEKSDVQVQLGADDKSLRQLLVTVPQYLGN